MLNFGRRIEASRLPLPAAGANRAFSERLDKSFMKRIVNEEERQVLVYNLYPFPLASLPLSVKVSA